MIILAIAPLMWGGVAWNLLVSDDVPWGLLAGGLALAVLGASVGMFLQQLVMALRAAAHPGPVPIPFAHLSGLRAVPMTLFALGITLSGLSDGPNPLAIDVILLVTMLLSGGNVGLGLGATLSRSQYPLPAPRPIQHPHAHGTLREP